MSGHEHALTKGLIARLAADATLKALVGDPARILDQPADKAVYPYLLVGRGESRPVAAEGCGVEHRLTLSCVSRFGGTEEARAICSAVRAALTDAAVEADGIRTVSLTVTFTDVFRTSDIRQTNGVMRVRAVTEET